MENISNLTWYKQTYNDLVTTRKSRGLNKLCLDYYTEIHHIVPRCMGGTDDEENLVLLTAREHIIAHMLLVRIYPEHLGIIRSTSAILLKNKGRKEGKLFSSRLVAEVRENYAKHKDEFSKEQLGKEVSEEIRKKQSESHIGNRLSERTKEILKEKRYSISIKTPEGKVYNSIADCSRSENIPETTLKDWIYNRPEKGYKILGTNRKSKSLKVIGPDGKIYPSIRQGAKDLKIDKKTLKNWIIKHPELGYKFID